MFCILEVLEQQSLGLFSSSLIFKIKKRTLAMYHFNQLNQLISGTLHFFISITSN